MNWLNIKAKNDILYKITFDGKEYYKRADSESQAFRYFVASKIKESTDGIFWFNRNSYNKDMIGLAVKKLMESDVKIEIVKEASMNWNKREANELSNKEIKDCIKAMSKEELEENLIYLVNEMSDEDTKEFLGLEMKAVLLNKKADEEKKKIHVEKLQEDAYNWWNNLDDGTTQKIITELYMKENNITDKDVDW